MSVFSLNGTLQFAPKVIDGNIVWASTVASPISLKNGTGVSQANLFWEGSVTLGPGDDDEINLLSLPFSALGGSGTAAFASVKFLAVVNESPNVSVTVEPGAANGWEQFGGCELGKSGTFSLYSPAAGLPVTGTSKTILFTSNGTTTQLTGNTTSGAASVTSLSSTSGLAVGMLVSGTGVPANAKIASVTNGTSIVLSANSTATGSGVSLDFQWPDVVIKVYAAGIED